ncbi:hypothetical protein IC582_029885 [Cucumis melo]
MFFKMTMYKPNSRIIRLNSDRCPPSPRHRHRVSFRWINQIVLRRIPTRVEIPKSPAYNEEIVPMNMDRMILHTKKIRALKHDFQICSIWNRQKLCPKFCVHVFG